MVEITLNSSRMELILEALMEGTTVAPSDNNRLEFAKTLLSRFHPSDSPEPDLNNYYTGKVSPHELADIYDTLSQAEDQWRAKHSSLLNQRSEAIFSGIGTQSPTIFRDLDQAIQEYDEKIELAYSILERISYQIGDWPKK